ncbi:MAG: ATP-binding protein, partial [Gemmataceae bacterium]
LKGWQIVRKNQAKVHQLVMDMLTYSKDREPEISLVDLNTLVGDVVELMQPRAEERGISLSTKLDESLPLVPADPESMHRCLLNIVGNALDAVQGHENPQVLITTSREPLGGSVKEPFARIQVIDNGDGIDPNMIHDIFKPFVSTKGSKGTGLGLAVSRKMMREQGGDILVTSELGKGSVFTLRLPLRSPLGHDPSITRSEMPVAPF